MFQIFGIGTLIVAAFVLLWIWNSINASRNGSAASS